MFVLLTRLCLCAFVCRRIPPSQAAIALLLQEVRSAGCWHKLKGLAISLDAWRAMLAQNDHVRVLRLLCSGVNRQSVNIISIDNRQSTIDNRHGCRIREKLRCLSHIASRVSFQLQFKKRWHCLSRTSKQCT